MHHIKVSFFFRLIAAFGNQYIGSTEFVTVTRKSFSVGLIKNSYDWLILIIENNVNLKMGGPKLSLERFFYSNLFPKLFSYFHFSILSYLKSVTNAPLFIINLSNSHLKTCFNHQITIFWTIKLNKLTNKFYLYKTAFFSCERLAFIYYLYWLFYNTV